LKAEEFLFLHPHANAWQITPAEMVADRRLAYESLAKLFAYCMLWE
jgi:hypothetical protein